MDKLFNPVNINKPLSLIEELLRGRARLLEQIDKTKGNTRIVNAAEIDYLDEKINSLLFSDNGDDYIKRLVEYYGIKPYHAQAAEDYMQLYASTQPDTPASDIEAAVSASKNRIRFSQLVDSLGRILNHISLRDDDYITALLIQAQIDVEKWMNMDNLSDGERELVSRTLTEFVNILRQYYLQLSNHSLPISKQSEIRLSRIGLVCELIVNNSKATSSSQDFASNKDTRPEIQVIEDKVEQLGKIVDKEELNKESIERFWAKLFTVEKYINCIIEQKRLTGANKRTVIGFVTKAVTMAHQLLNRQQEVETLPDNAPQDEEAFGNISNRFITLGRNCDRRVN